MQYKTFRGIALVGALGLLVGGGVCVTHFVNAPSNNPPVIVNAPPVVPVPQPQAYVPAVPIAAQPPIPTVATTNQIRADLEAWLATHSDRQGQMQLNNVLPHAPYCANVLRFADEAAATRNQQQPNQWSMFRIDRDRDGRIDEKWLLRNGHTFKREVFGPDGRSVVETQFFDS